MLTQPKIRMADLLAWQRGRLVDDTGRVSVVPRALRAVCNTVALADAAIDRAMRKAR